MADQSFVHINHWVFDLDNTLYPPGIPLFSQIEALMVDYITELLGIEPAAANLLRRHYWQKYGTTLAGLIAEHHIDPRPFLERVHDIDFAALQPDIALSAAITALPGRKIVYTNGTVPYARRVLAACGLEDAFDSIFGVEDASYRSKPAPAAFSEVFEKAAIRPELGVMFEDDVRNLQVPFSLGMKTVHVSPKPRFETYITHHTKDLAAFLSALMRP